MGVEPLQGNGAVKRAVVRSPNRRHSTAPDPSLRNVSIGDDLDLRVHQAPQGIYGGRNPGRGGYEEAAAFDRQICG